MSFLPPAVIHLAGRIHPSLARSVLPLQLTKEPIMAEVTSGADRTIIILNNEEASALAGDLNFLNIDGDLSPELHSLADAMGVTMVVA